MAEINCEDKTVREINTGLKGLIAEGETQIWLKKPGARHNLGVAILQPVQLIFEGSVGYYCAGMIDGPTVDIRRCPGR